MNEPQTPSEWGRHHTEPQPQQQPDDERPWYQRKRIVIPLALLALLVFGAIANTDDEDDVDLVDDDTEEEIEDVGEEVTDDDGDEPEDDPPEPEPEPEPEDEPDDGDETDWAEVFGDLDVSPAEFRERWNNAIQDMGLGYGMDEITPTTEYLDFPSSEHQIDDWGEVTVVLTEDESSVVQLLIDAIPTTEEQGTDLIGTMTAALAAAADMPAEDAFERLQTDLAMTEDIDSDDHFEEAVIDGVLVEIDAIEGIWSFFTGADT